MYLLTFDDSDKNSSMAFAIRNEIPSPVKRLISHRGGKYFHPWKV